MWPGAPDDTAKPGDTAISGDTVRPARPCPAPVPRLATGLATHVATGLAIHLAIKHGCHQERGARGGSTQLAEGEIVTSSSRVSI